MVHGTTATARGLAMGYGLSIMEPAMKVISSVAAWKSLRPTLPRSLGLVPTMGALHDGHLSLVRRCRAENEVAVVWIFVNPKQFGPNEDFEKYPRDMEGDLLLLEEAGVDYVFSPPVEDVYPPGYQTTVAVAQVSQPLEGASRPEHFHGVTTVVAKMFCLTQPERAYFGQKDAQQCVVVKRMVADLGMLVEIVVCPTVRERDGLAMSSRNVYLEPMERQHATALYRALQCAERAVAEGERDGDALRESMRTLLESVPGLIIEYVSVAHPDTLEELSHLTGNALVSLAVKLGKTRLIDNLPIVMPAEQPRMDLQRGGSAA